MCFTGLTKFLNFCFGNPVPKPRDADFEPNPGTRSSKFVPGHRLGSRSCTKPVTVFGSESRDRVWVRNPRQGSSPKPGTCYIFFIRNRGKFVFTFSIVDGIVILVYLFAINLRVWSLSNICNGYPLQCPEHVSQRNCNGLQRIAVTIVYIATDSRCDMIVTDGPLQKLCRCKSVANKTVVKPSQFRFNNCNGLVRCNILLQNQRI